MHAWDDAHEAQGPCAAAARRARTVAWEALDLALVRPDDVFELERTVEVDPCQMATVRGRLGALGATYECGPGPSLRFTDPAGTVVTVVSRGAAQPAQPAQPAPA